MIPCAISWCVALVVDPATSFCVVHHVDQSLHPEVCDGEDEFDDDEDTEDKDDDR